MTVVVTWLRTRPSNSTRKTSGASSRAIVRPTATGSAYGLGTGTGLRLGDDHDLIVGAREEHGVGVRQVGQQRQVAGDVVQERAVGRGQARAGGVRTQLDRVRRIFVRVRVQVVLY